MPEPFDALAVDLARFQAAHVPGYAPPVRGARRRPRAASRARGSARRPDRRVQARPRLRLRRGATRRHVPHERHHARARARRARDARRRRPTTRRRSPSGAAMLARGLDGARARPRRRSLRRRGARLVARAHVRALRPGARAAGPDARTFFVRGGALDVGGLRARVASLSRADRPRSSWPRASRSCTLLDALGGEIAAAPSGQPRDADRRLQGASRARSPPSSCAATWRGRSPCRAGGGRRVRDDRAVEPVLGGDAGRRAARGTASTSSRRGRASCPSTRRRWRRCRRGASGSRASRTW